MSNGIKGGWVGGVILRGRGVNSVCVCVWGGGHLTVDTA